MSRATFSVRGWTRREILESGAAGVFTLAASRLGQTDSATTSALYEKAVVVDGLSYLRFMPLSDAGVDDVLLKRVAESGITAINYTVSAGTFESTVRTIARWTDQIERNPRALLQARSVADIERAKRERMLAVLFGFQDPVSLDGSLERLEMFHQLGVRIVQLTENFQNEIGSGCNERRDGGLTRFGRTLVRRMNELGMLVDVSHCGPRTTLDAIEASTQPVAITHSNCAAVHGTPRAKSDEAIQALAARGGVMGITFLNFFVGPRPHQTVSDVIDHIDHVRRVAGIDHAAIGSDLPIGSFLDIYPDERSFMKALEPYIAASGSTYIRWPATIEGSTDPETPNAGRRPREARVHAVRSQESPRRKFPARASRIGRLGGARRSRPGRKLRATLWARQAL